MTATNDITGDSLNTRHSTQKYRDNWGKIFSKGKEDKVKNVTLYGKLDDASYDTYNVCTVNGKPIGTMYKETDGYYVFSFVGKCEGCYPVSFFRDITHKLEYLNKDWDRTVRESL